MAIEDFTIYTEVDPNGKLTVISSKADAVNADDDEDVYLYKDFGADYFDDLDIDFDIYISSASLPSARGGMAVANTLGVMAGFATTDISAFAYYDDVVGARIYLRRGFTVILDWWAASLNTLYYCTLERTAGGDTVTLEIYSDAVRTVLVDTLSVAGFGAVKLRYLYGFVNANSGVSGRDFDGYVQNMDLHLPVVGGYAVIF